MTNSQHAKLESIQVIRGIAAILVLLFHASYLVQYRLGYNLTPYFWFGYSGVDIFFVLSGFIIFYTTSNHTTRSTFFLRRLLRIYPMYWMAIFLVLVIAYSSQALHLGSDSSISNAVTDASFFSKLGTFLLIPKSSDIIKISWTLSYEMAFYSLFAIFFFYSKNLFIAILMLWATLSLVTAFYFKMDYAQPDNPMIAMINPIMIEFIFGCGIAILCLKYKNIFSNRKLTWLFFLLMSIGIISYISSVMLVTHEFTKLASTNQYSRFIIYGMPAAIIIFSSIYLPISYFKWLTFLGDASYSIYLFHYPIMGVMAKLMIALGMTSTNLIGFMAITLVTTTICCLLYLLIEKPLLNRGKAYVKRQSLFEMNE